MRRRNQDGMSFSAVKSEYQPGHTYFRHTVSFTKRDYILLPQHCIPSIMSSAWYKVGIYAVFPKRNYNGGERTYFQFRSLLT